jgi:hypothetical protein
MEIAVLILLGVLSVAFWCYALGTPIERDD